MDESVQKEILLVAGNNFMQVWTDLCNRKCSWQLETVLCRFGPIFATGNALVQLESILCEYGRICARGNPKSKQECPKLFFTVMTLFKSCSLFASNCNFLAIFKSCSLFLILKALLFPSVPSVCMHHFMASSSAKSQTIPYQHLK